MNYQEIIQKNIKEFDEIYWGEVTNKQDWYKNQFISYLEEENKRLEESKKVETRHDTCGIDFDTFEGYCYNHKENITTLDKPTGATDFNQAINEQVEHNKNVIAYLKGL